MFWREPVIEGFLCACVCVTESTYRHQANVDDEVVAMEILDTAGQVSTFHTNMDQIDG